VANLSSKKVDTEFSYWNRYFNPRDSDNDDEHIMRRWEKMFFKFKGMETEFLKNDAAISILSKPVEFPIKSMENVGTTAFSVHNFFIEDYQHYPPEPYRIILG
jgi:hypothetical protein